MGFFQKPFKILQDFWNMFSEKGEKQNKIVIYLLLIEVFVLVLILGVTDNGELAVALGTISMALAIVYIEIIKPWLQKPEIKIEFDNKVPFCRDCFISNETKFGYFIRLKIRNVGRSLAKDLRGKLVKIIDKDGKIDKKFDPLFLHWTSVPLVQRVEMGKDEKWLDPIDLNVGEWEYLDVFNTKTLKLKKDDNENSPKETEKGRVYLGTKQEKRGCRMDLYISEGLKAFKITIYGKNIDPVTETYKLKWDGENYDEINMEPYKENSKTIEKDKCK